MTAPRHGFLIVAGSHKGGIRGKNTTEQLELFSRRVINRIERKDKELLWKTLVRVKLENGAIVNLSLKTLRMLRKISIEPQGMPLPPGAAPAAQRYGQTT